MHASLHAKALALLARREHTRSELRQKLLPLADDPATLDALLETLAETRQLSDARYAENRVEVRGRRYGGRRLQQELQQAGVAAELIAAVLPDAESELEHCRAVWQKKFGQAPDSPRETARQVNFLRYRGFAPDIIRRVIAHDEGEDEK